MFLKRIIYFTLLTALVNVGCKSTKTTISEPVEIIVEPIFVAKSEILISPTYLQPGDTVAIVSPAGNLNNKVAEIEQATKLLQSWNLNVVVGENVFNQNNEFAGTDEERAADFQKALDNPNIKAIWCARGGYGTVRILDKLDYTKFKEHPKWVIGYSDITAIHSQLHNLGYESIHGIMGISLDIYCEFPKENADPLKDALFGKQLAYTIEGSSDNRPGSATGQLVGGNLTLLHTMLGSKTSIDTSEKILFIEEVGEHAYHIDRMLQSLKRAGYFENCNGMVVGAISKIKGNILEDWGKPIEQLILDVVKEYNFPVLFNFPAGHEEDNRTLILGRTVELTVGNKESSLVFKN
ncbi:MAG: LD-carboxypeptidase [Bacteroidetes bacterium HGW-Bacteroidetes-3]|nr:MAG: LD-carboxypeptidase [Bacteroidetes bacterium HGW-Bacteroidetes-3]